MSSSSNTTANANNSSNALLHPQQHASSLKVEKPIQEPIRSQNKQDDEGYEDDDGVSVGRAFSVISFSLHRRPSLDSALTVSTARCDPKAPSVAPSNGEAKSLSKKGSGSVGGKKKMRREKETKFSWLQIRDRNREQKEELEADEVCEKDQKGFEADLEANSKVDEESYPDGGFKAWMMVFGSMLCTFSTFGYVNSWGIFQSYYQGTILKDSSPSDIAWIGSIQYSLIFFPAFIVGRLFDLGYLRHILLSSSVLSILATFLVAECKVYWQFLLCQGIVFGLASGGVFGPTAPIVAHWFKKRRGLAMGFVAVGSAIGGTVLPIATKNLIAHVGFKWTMRILGLILVFTLGLANLILRHRLPPVNVSGGLINLSAFRSPSYTIYCFSAFICYLGIYTVLTYIDVSAAGVPGVSYTLGFYLVSIANAASFFGRYISGVVSDKVGPMNVMIPFTVVAGVMTYIWPYARTKHGLVAIAVVYGLCSGAYVSLMANPLMEFGDTGDVGRRLGMFMSILAVGALAGPPISGAILRTSGGFVAMGWYAGSMVLIGVAMMGTTRWLVLRRWWGRI
ncbi:hypothetical protein AX15_002740 [Amanita polypyramis BW_CC]|nr:hypothetical protein AX15_002740 [Amanita polypyramis BW_CC]